VLRIIGGDFRSRPLAVPQGHDLTRPMGSRTREALFNLLRGWFDGAIVVDLFAGVGTLGLEAASRGAARVVCVERDRTIVRLLRQNIEALRCGDRVTVIEGDALAEGTIAALPRPVDLVFCDPPFAMVIEHADHSMGHEQMAHAGESNDLLDAVEPDESIGLHRGARRAVRARTRSADRRDPARLEAMLRALPALFGPKGFLALRLPMPRRGAEGAIAGFAGPEIHGYGDQQWIHLYAPARFVAAAPDEGSAA